MALATRELHRLLTWVATFQYPRRAVRIGVRISAEADQGIHRLERLYRDIEDDELHALINSARWDLDALTEHLLAIDRRLARAFGR